MVLVAMAGIGAAVTPSLDGPPPLSAVRSSSTLR
jgi:hypothetical protein